MSDNTPTTATGGDTSTTLTNQTSSSPQLNDVSVTMPTLPYGNSTEYPAGSSTAVNGDTYQAPTSDASSSSTSGASDSNAMQTQQSTSNSSGGFLSSLNPFNNFTSNFENASFVVFGGLLLIAGVAYALFQSDTVKKVASTTAKTVALAP